MAVKCPVARKTDTCTERKEKSLNITMVIDFGWFLGAKMH